MQPTQTLTPEQQFFFDNAGWAYRASEETPEQGRTRGAIILAENEALYLEAHKVSTVACEWHEDENFHNEKCDTCECASITVHDERSGKRVILSYVGCVLDATEDYRRVIRAELVCECADDLRAIVDGSGA
jgi:hypothetical protein